ncbi:DUF4362 domain-containing protein [Cytobacillus sp. Hz8]|uniref:DUF4362 domain-containing protein n=1 Tax=Cytobacillus sp. Hz8 TaxID=3347168 RepID=UPI0035E111CD
MKIFLFGVMTFLIVINTLGCSKNEAYNSQEAIKRGDIVYQNEVVNLERLKQFLINLSNKKEDTIRITGYTIEGDPIFHDLQFDGKVIQYTYDNSNDHFAGDDKGTEKDVCKEVVKKENEHGEAEFLLSGCSKGNSLFLLRVEKEKLKKQWSN